MRQRTACHETAEKLTFYSAEKWTKKNDVDTGTISNLNARIYTTIEEWRQKPIEGEHPYVYLDGISLKRSLRRRGQERIGPCSYRREP